MGPFYLLRLKIHRVCGQVHESYLNRALRQYDDLFDFKIYYENLLYWKDIQGLNPPIFNIFKILEICGACGGGSRLYTKFER